MGAQFLGGQRFKFSDDETIFSDKTNSSETPFNVLFLLVNEETCDVLKEGENEGARILHYKSKDCRIDRDFKSCNI